jgi:hypothetical protein
MSYVSERSGLLTIHYRPPFAAAPVTRSIPNPNPHPERIGISFMGAHLKSRKSGFRVGVIGFRH